MPIFGDGGVGAWFFALRSHFQEEFHGSKTGINQTFFHQWSKQIDLSAWAGLHPSSRGFGIVPHPTRYDRFTNHLTQIGWQRSGVVEYSSSIGELFVANGWVPAGFVPKKFRNPFDCLG